MDTSPTGRLMQFFEYDHLPPALAEVSAPFFDLATEMHLTLPGGPEKTTAIHKLLEAKDCAVRAKIDRFSDPEIG